MPAFKNEDLALNLKYDTYYDPVSGTSQSIPMLDAKWIEVEEVEFISYVAPPVQVNLLSTQTIAECDECEMQAWEERANFILNDINWLLCQSHSQFWNQVIFNKSINVCLDSYLKLSPRSFDVWKFLPEEILNLQKQIHRGIFMVYLRMSTYKESKDEFFTQSTFGEIIYENFLFDIPKIMDLCALYGGEESENKKLLTKMLDNVFSKQPKYVDDLYQMIPSIFQTFEVIEKEVGVTDDKGGPQKLGKEHSSGSKMTNDNDIVLYLFDISQTLLSLLQTLPILCQHFFKVGLVPRLVSFYEEVVPLLREKYRRTSSKSARTYLKRCDSRLIKLTRLIMNVCCLDPLSKSTDEVSKETKENCIECFLSVVTEMLSSKRFLRVYNSYQSIEQDINIIQQSCLPFDETRIQYIISAVGSLEESTDSKSHLSSKKHNSSKKTKLNQAFPKPSIQPSTAVMTKKVDDLEVELMVSHVNELFPDCGEGFIITCLRQLNYDVEKTINLILEDNLPPQLHNLDRKLPKEDVASSSDVLATRYSVYDEDEFDVFSKDTVDMSRVHKGKSRVTEDTRTVLDDKKDFESFKEVVLNYNEFFNDYEDEYDDTYDTHDVGAQDVDSADELREITMRRPFTTPIVLRNMKGSSDEEKDSDNCSTSNNTHERSNNTHERRNNTHERSNNTHEGRGNTHERSNNTHERRNNTHERRNNTHERSDNTHERRNNTHERSDNTHERRNNTHERSDNTHERRNNTHERSGASKNNEKDNPGLPQRNHGNTSAEATAGKRYSRGSKDEERDRSYKDKHKAKHANHNRKAAAAKKQARGMGL